MNDTYAVVNKPKHPHPSLKNTTHSDVALPSRTLLSSHYYDNDSKEALATPIYSCVRRQDNLTTPTYDTASSANHRLGEELLSLHTNKEHHMVADEQISPTNDDYEEFSSDLSTFCPQAGIGFNCRIQKPRGPREPPSEWS